MLATGGREGRSSQKIFRTYQKISGRTKKFSGDINIYFFPRKSQNFPGHIKILPENNRIFQEIPKYKNKSNRKSKAIRQRMQSKRHFSRRYKRHFAPGKRALLKSWGGGHVPPVPPLPTPLVRDTIR